MSSDGHLLEISKSLQLAQSDLAEKWPQDLSLNMLNTKMIEGDLDLDRDLNIEIERTLESADLTGSNIDALKNSLTHFQRLASTTARDLADERAKSAEATKLLSEMEQILQAERARTEALERQNREAGAVIATQDRRIQTLRARSFVLVERLDSLADTVRIQDQSARRG